MKHLTVEQLTALLLDTEKAHAIHEQVLGHHDDNWASWYAQYIYTAVHAPKPHYGSPAELEAYETRMIATGEDFAGDVFSPDHTSLPSPASNYL